MVLTSLLASVCNTIFTPIYGGVSILSRTCKNWLQSSSPPKKDVVIKNAPRDGSREAFFTSCLEGLFDHWQCSRDPGTHATTQVANICVTQEV